jgi:hypothetical protein
MFFGIPKNFFSSGAGASFSFSSILEISFFVSAIFLFASSSFC